MSTDIASPELTIDSSDSDVTSLAQRLHDCFSLIQDHRSTFLCYINFLISSQSPF
jgi:hypothetical protein